MNIPAAASTIKLSSLCMRKCLYSSDTPIHIKQSISALKPGSFPQTISSRNPQTMPVIIAVCSLAYDEMHSATGISRSGLRKLPEVAKIQQNKMITAYRKILTAKFLFSYDDIRRVLILFMLFALSGVICNNHNTGH